MGSGIRTLRRSSLVLYMAQDAYFRRFVNAAALITGDNPANAVVSADITAVSTFQLQTVPSSYS